MDEQPCMKCSVCQEGVVNTGKDLMNHKCFKEQIDKKKTVSSESKSSLKCTVFKCSFCMKAVMKVDGKWQRHKCQMKLRPAKPEQKAVKPTKTLFKCSLCNTKLEKVGDKFMSHKCSILGNVKLPKLGLGVNTSSVVCKTYLMCHLCNKLVEKVGQGMKEHECLVVEDVPMEISSPTEVINEKLDQTIEELVGKNIATFYKRKGALHPLYTNLSEDDLIIVIFKDTQCEIFKQYCHSFICIDVADDPQKDVKLVTLTVMSEEGLEYPCCFMLTNRLDSAVADLLFEVIKSAVKAPLTTSTLMTNASAIFWNSWNTVMGTCPSNWLFSTWQVEAAWNKNLSLIRNEEHQAGVQQTLRSLLYEKDATKFSQALGSALEQWALDEVTVDFSSYFIAEFSHNVANWAVCHRSFFDNQKNLNMVRVHTKCLYIQHLLNRSSNIQEFISSLSRIVDASETPQSIQRQHNAALQMLGYQATATSQGWTFQSDLNTYNITVGNLSCNCKLKCDTCNICCHSFICDCPASSVNICIHVHYLAVNNVLTISDSIDTMNAKAATVNLDGFLDDRSTVIDLVPSLQKQTIDLPFDIAPDDNVEPPKCVENDDDVVPNELDLEKKELQLHFQQILDQLQSLRDVRILENMMKPILPTIVAAQKADSTESTSRRGGRTSTGRVFHRS